MGRDLSGAGARPPAGGSADPRTRQWQAPSALEHADGPVARQAALQSAGQSEPWAGDSLLPFAVSKPGRATPRGAGKPAGAGHRALRRDGGGVGRDCLPHGAGEEDLAVMAGQLCQGSALPLHPLPQGLPCQQGQEQACRWGKQRGGWREASGGESHVHLTASLRVIRAASQSTPRGTQETCRSRRGAGKPLPLACYQCSHRLLAFLSQWDSHGKQGRAEQRQGVTRSRFAPFQECFPF